MIITINGLNIAYDDRGQGFPVFLMHGWGGYSASFLPVANYLLERGFRVISIDFPGHGGSDEPETPWSVTEFAQITRQFIEKLNIWGCFAIGHSFGGRVAICLAAENPDIFKKIVFVDAAGVLPKRKLKYYIKVYAYKLVKKIARIQAINRLFRLDSKIKKAGSSDYQALNENMKRTFVRVVNQDLTPMLSKIKAPSLLIWGDKDESTPLYMAKIMEREIPDTGLVIFEGAGHFSYLDQLQKFCVIISAFLEEN